MRNHSNFLIDNNELDYELNINSLFDFIEGGPVLLLDADPIAYKAAAACDTSTYNLLINDNPTYTIEGGVTDLYKAFSVKDKKEWDILLANNPTITVEKVITPDSDPKQMYHTIKAQVRRVIKKVGAGSVELLLTDGASNFRLTENIATVLKYKGNRSNDSKPSLLSDARKYLIEELGAELCIGLEADDELSIRHQKYWDKAMLDAEEFYLTEDVSVDLLEPKAMELTQSVLATIDKDIKMRSGKFINPDQDMGVEEIYPLGHLFLEVKEKPNKPTTRKLQFSGLKGFYAQILKGDDCDNIPSLYFCGDVRTYDILKDCKNEEELFKATLSEIYRGFHREHIKSLDTKIIGKVETAIELGAKDTPSNRTKLKKKYKDFMIGNVQFCDKNYYHWCEYLEKEDGTVSNELKDPLTAKLISITPIDYMKEVARLVYMLVVPPNEEGTHLWEPPEEKWVKDVQNKFLEENLTRLPMDWC